MTQEELARALKLLFENFWIIRKNNLEDYAFLRRHQTVIQKEVRQRFGMNVVIRPQYIQLLKRPHEFAPWMGITTFTSTFDYGLFCCAMAYAEGLEAETPFMLDELINDLDLIAPEELGIDWKNYNHRKSLVRVIKKMLNLSLIETIQGETSDFEQSEENLEVLYTTTVQARAFLSRAPKSYSTYASFAEYWQDWQESRNLEGNQLLYQRLMMEPIITRTPENEETFIRLRNYHRYLKDYVETFTEFQLELYRDYVVFALEQRDGWEEVFPSRKVVDEILIQLGTILRKNIPESTPYGIIRLSFNQWQKLLQELVESYHQYWSSEFKKMSLPQLSEQLLARGSQWQLFTKQADHIEVQPVFGRLIGEMRDDNE